MRTIKCPRCSCDRWAYSITGVLLDTITGETWIICTACRVDVQAGRQPYLETFELSPDIVKE